MASPLVLAVVLAALQAEPTEPEHALPVRVNAAIQRAVAHLKARQDAEGRWRWDETRYPGGLTAFCAYALLESGVPADDPVVARALEVLETLPPRSTYGAAARAFLYTRLGDDERWREHARASTAFLLEHQTGGLWGYPDPPLDMSNVQFALFALRTARRSGIDVPDEAFVDCAKSLWRWQAESGAFRYHEGRTPTASITTATLSGLAVLREVARDSKAVASALRRHEKDSRRALAWLEEHWSPERNAYGEWAWTPGFHAAGLWALERWADLEGVERVAGRDWYAEGAEHLLAEQRPEGELGDTYQDTAFALLFLRRVALSGPRSADGAKAASAVPPPSGGRPEAPAGARPLTRWLVAGPWLGREGATGLADPPFDPAAVRVEEKAKLGGKRWGPIELDAEGWTDVEARVARPSDRALWALGARLANRGEDAPIEVDLWLAFEDGWRVFLDGREVSASRRVQAPIRFDTRVALALEPGEHELLVLLDDEIGASAFGARVCAPGGGPAPAELVVEP